MPKMSAPEDWTISRLLFLRYAFISLFTEFGKAIGGLDKGLKTAKKICSGFQSFLIASKVLAGITAAFGDTPTIGAVLRVADAAYSGSIDVGYGVFVNNACKYLSCRWSPIPKVGEF